MPNSKNPLSDRKKLSPETQLVHGGTKRTAFNETSEAIFMNSGYSYPSSQYAEDLFLIEYVPADWCIESKSLKLYLWSYRDRAVFAEAMAAEIAAEVMLSAKPQHVRVTLTQRPRGGIEVQAVAELGTL